MHCPVSNLASTGLIAPTAAWLDAGMRVALGTDFANTSFWEVMRTAWLLLGAQGRHDAGGPARVLQMATRNGALAYGRPDLGEIAVGRAADLVFLDAGRLLPYVDRDDVSTLAHAVLTQGRAEIVRHVLVGGRWALRNGETTLVDGDDVDQAYKALISRLFDPTQH